MYPVTIPKSILVGDRKFLHPSGLLFLLESNMQFPNLFINIWQLASSCTEVSYMSYALLKAWERILESRWDIIRHHLAISHIVFLVSPCDHQYMGRLWFAQCVIARHLNHSHWFIHVSIFFFSHWSNLKKVERPLTYVFR